MTTGRTTDITHSVLVHVTAGGPTFAAAHVAASPTAVGPAQSGVSNCCMPSALQGLPTPSLVSPRLRWQQAAAAITRDEARSPLTPHRGSSPRSPFSIDKLRNFFGLSSPDLNAQSEVAAEETADIELELIEIELEEIRLKELELEEESRDRRRRFQQKLSVVRSNLTVFSDCLRHKRINTLVEIQPGLVDANARLTRMLQGDRVHHDTALASELEELRSGITDALHQYDEHRTQEASARSAAASPPWPPRPPPVSVPSEWPAAIEGASPSTAAPSRAAPCTIPRLPFCLLASTTCVLAMLIEIGANGWGLQPMWCPHTGAVDAHGECEANIMIGPRIRVLDALGAKNDVAIFEHGEWWRLFTCQWLHAGMIHLVLNLIALLSLGAGVERAFGPLRTLMLFIWSGLFGTICSALFLPGVLSVGASGGVYGLVGAYWADVLLNYLAHGCGAIRDAGVPSLIVATLPGVLAGMTPWVDNFMHVGGLLAGMALAMLMLPQLGAEQSRLQHLDAVYGIATLDGDAAPRARVGPTQARQLDAIQVEAAQTRAASVALSPLAIQSPLRRRSTRSLPLPAAAAAAAVVSTTSTSTHVTCEVGSKRQRVRGAVMRTARGVWARSGYGRLTGVQSVLVLVAAGLAVNGAVGSLGAVASTSVQQLLRRGCGRACASLSCVEIGGWWECCAVALPGTCTLEYNTTWLGGRVPEQRLVAHCNVSGLPDFTTGCDASTAGGDAQCAAWNPAVPAATSALCQRLCLEC